MKNTKYHSSMIKPPKTKAEFIALMDLAIYVLDEIHNDLHEIGEILESQHSKKEQRRKPAKNVLCPNQSVPQGVKIF